MPSGKGSDYADAVVTMLLGGPAVVVPPTLFVALFTTVPEPENNDGTEVVGGGYARQPVLNVPASWTPVFNGSKQNVNVINFGVAAGGWGVIVGFTLEDAVMAPSIRVYYATLARPKTVVVGSAVRFDPGELVVEEQ